MSKPSPEDDVNDLIEDCIEIIELLNKNQTGLGRWSIGGENWPEINLTPDDISYLTSTLEKDGKKIAKIRIFSDKIDGSFPQLAQQIVDAHAKVLYYATAMEQGRVHSTDLPDSRFYLHQLKQSLENFESNYRIQKSYSSIKYDYGDIETQSSRGIHWGKAGIIVAIIIGIISIVAAYEIGLYFYNLSIQHEQHLANSTDVSKTITQQAIMEQYSNGQPYSLHWTDCGDLNKTVSDGKTNWKITLKPILLDKNGNAAIIQFNTTYNFGIADVFSVYPQNFEPINVTAQTIDPSNREPVILNLTKTLNDAENMGVNIIRINLIESSFAPYSDKTGSILVDYVHDKNEYSMTDLTYLPSLGKWIRTDADNSVCKNLIQR